MTEEEALTKMCPMQPDQMCRASGCMAWRHTSVGYEDEDGNFVWKGYCGMAGKL